uniref:ABC transporter permease n=1 Tax=Thermosporothrix sp. COM3 TaxID=2490863 RepID=A0A455SG36_9CHLR|nr:ABC transporter permease [Thermosporothrix sp. COM3]
MQKALHHEGAASVRTRPKQRRSGLLLTILLHVVLIVFSVVMVAPFLWMLVSSFESTEQAFSIPPTWIPDPIMWENYPQSLQALPFHLAYWNSTLVAVTVTLCQLITCSLAGYAFARLRFPGRDIIFFLFLATLMIPFQLTIIPIFLTMKELNLLDNLLSLILPPSLFSAFGVFLMRQFIMGLPTELEEAAIIDGASRWAIFWRVIFPLLKAPLSALGIFAFLSQWNDFFRPLIMLNSSENFTVPLLLNQFRGQYATEWTLVMAGSVIAIVPVLIVYLLAQRYVIQGIAMTGLKA